MLKQYESVKIIRIVVIYSKDIMITCDAGKDLNYFCNNALRLFDCIAYILFRS
jgi:hypothetical protein